MNVRTILHCDLNNFYASVELLSRPEFVGLPIAVAGDPEKRHGIVLAKNNEAKACGVATGDTLWQAQGKCPNITFFPPNFREYVKYSAIARSIYKRYTDKVEPFGMDECWLDVTSTLGLFGDGVKIANEIRETVNRETGLTISVGVSFTKVFAKLGSDMKKPDAVTVITKENFRDKIWALPAADMLGVGRKTSKKLELFGVRTIGELACADEHALSIVFGKLARDMISHANGTDREEVLSCVDNSPLPKSVGNGTTTARDITDLDTAKTVIYALSENVATRLRKYGLQASGVSLAIRYATLNGISRQMALPRPTSNAIDLAEGAIKLLLANHSFPNPLRAITVTAFRLDECGVGQIGLFDDEQDKQARLERAVDNLRTRYGYSTMTRGVVFKNDILDHSNLHEDDDFKPFG